MLRTLGYFVVVILAMILLRQVPLVGGLFRIPLLGFLLTVAVVGVASERLGTALVSRRRYSTMARNLGQVETPHNRGKLGSLLVAQKRYSAALEPLEAAVAGEPDFAEWWYRLGMAYIGVNQPADAVDALEHAVELNEEHAYGAALLRLAEAQQDKRDFEAALAAVERHDLGHGTTAESAYRRGLALRALGRADEARDAFTGVGRAASSAAKYQRAEARRWAARAFFARRVG